jgi:oxygen-independent coproporphyrinogen-3 oxidase
MERFRSGAYQENNQLNQTMFEITENVLAGAGYHHYEISNHARPGFECRHNLAYWTGCDYLGLGPSAVSTVNGRRWKSVGGKHVAIESLTPGERVKEQALLELRTSRGADAGRFSSGQLTPLVEAGLASLQNGRLILTRAGRLRADEIAVHLI